MYCFRKLLICIFLYNEYVIVYKYMVEVSVFRLRYGIIS